MFNPAVEADVVPSGALRFQSGAGFRGDGVVDAVGRCSM